MTDDHAATKALPDDLLAYMRSHIKAKRDDLDGFLAIGNEVNRAATYDRWLVALSAPATPVARILQVGDNTTPANRLATMLTEALGADHPALTDLAALVLAASPAAPVAPASQPVSETASPRAPLTDEQIYDLLPSVSIRCPMDALWFARAIERAHGIGQEGGAS